MANPTDGYGVRQFPSPTKRIVQFLSLRNDPGLIREYRRLHSREAIWAEILDGIRAVGILEMEIYIHATNLVMILEVPADFDWDVSMSRLATLPRQAEWEDLVGRYQQAVEGQASSEKWHPMERMFHLYD